MAIRQPWDDPPPFGAGPKQPTYDWPKIMHSVITGDCNEKQFNDREMTADTVQIVDSKQAHMLGLVSVDRVVIRNLAEDTHTLRYRLKLNGVLLRVLEFDYTHDGKLGRLIAEYNAPIGLMERKEHKK